MPKKVRIPTPLRKLTNNEEIVEVSADNIGAAILELQSRYPGIKEPLIWQLSQKFPVITNIRQCSVTDEIGIVSLELEGKRADVKAAIKWLEKIGVSVEPVEINVIES